MPREAPIKALHCCIEAKAFGQTPDPLPILVIILIALWFFSRRNRIAGVAKVVSGNTIIVSGQTIRLYAMYGLFDGQPWIDSKGISFNGGERSKAALARGAQVAKVYHDDEDVAHWMVSEGHCLLYTSPSPRDQRGSRMPSSA